jgi:hypothetical protein
MPEAGDEGGAEQLHIAGEGDEVDIALLDPVADRRVTRPAVGVFLAWKDSRLDPGGLRPLQRPCPGLVRPDAHHLDRLPSVQPVEDRLKVGAAARGEDYELEAACHSAISRRSGRGSIARLGSAGDISRPHWYRDPGRAGRYGRRPESSRARRAVSEAGGLGTIAVNGAAAIENELAAARQLTDRPLSVNLLLPFARRDWFEAAGELTSSSPSGQAETADQGRLDPPVRLGRRGARRPRGRRRRSHPPGRRGRWPCARDDSALELLERARAELPHEYPLLLAGGIAKRPDVEQALEAGASAAVAGTRFLLSGREPGSP